MSKVATTGKKHSDGVVLVLGGEGGLAKIRCPKCKKLAPASRRSDGKTIYRCGACGTEFNRTSM